MQQDLAVGGDEYGTGETETREAREKLSELLPDLTTGAGGLELGIQIRAPLRSG